jgi:Domain of unknown function (DUF6265)
MCGRVNNHIDLSTRLMRYSVARSSLAVAILSVISSATALAQSPAPVDTLRWMSGCWTLSRGTRVTDEMWMVPRGGVMLGVARTVNAGQVRETEFSRIFAAHDTLVYAAAPSGQAGTQFRSKRVAPGEVVFENLAHDFPKRIAYRAVPPDSLHAYIEGATEGQGRIWYRFVRATCF